MDAVTAWFPRLHSLVIGPGLGRDPVILARVKKLIMVAKEMKKNIVIDAVSFTSVAGPIVHCTACGDIRCYWSISTPYG